MESKGEKSTIILGVIAIIAIVLMVLLVKSVSTGQSILRQPFTIGQSCGPMPDVIDLLDESKAVCTAAGREKCKELYGGQTSPYSSIGSCHKQCNKYVSNACRTAGGLLASQGGGYDERQWS